MDQLTIQALLSAALPSISKTTPPADTQQSKKPKLLSQDPPVSVPLLTIAFRRFIVKVTPIFYVQDRVEEVLLWKRGPRVGFMWAAAWGALCMFCPCTSSLECLLTQCFWIGYYPRLFLVLPHLILIAMILNRTLHPPASPVQGAGEQQDWQANLQGIQNLMFLYSNSYDAVVGSPVVRSLLSLRPPSAASEEGEDEENPVVTEQEKDKEVVDGRAVSALPLLLLTLPVPIFISYTVPIRLLLLVAGWTPLALGHPYIQSLLLLLLGQQQPHDEAALVRDMTGTSRRAEIAGLVVKARESEMVKKFMGDTRVKGVLEELVRVDVREEDFRKESSEAKDANLGSSK